MVSTQAERIAVVETKVGNIETKVDSLHTKFDEFVTTANDKYAEKKRVNDIEIRVNNHEAKLAWYAGGIGAIFIIIQLVIQNFPKG